MSVSIHHVKRLVLPLSRLIYSKSISYVFVVKLYLNLPNTLLLFLLNVFFTDKKVDLKEGLITFSHDCTVYDKQ